MALALIELVKLASTTSEHPRLNTRAARQVMLAIAEWLEHPDLGEAGRTIAAQLRREAR
jgi:hypothetical protein